MKSILLPAVFVLFSCRLMAASDVLIVADEFPQMKLFANMLERRAKTHCITVEQSNMPPDLSQYRTVVVFIHRVMQEATEKKLIEYANAGGKLLILHHSISQAKGKNRFYFDFLGMKLPGGDLSQGGYKWIEGVKLSIVNLAPDSYITTHNIKYPEQINYNQRQHPGFTLDNTEVYLNHTFIDGEDKKVLLGFKYQDADTGRVYMQDRAGWLKKAGKGWIIYFMPGHESDDFENPCYQQLLLNALDAKLN